MAIRSGIGIGEAQVFDTSGLANQYARQVAADQANLQRQAIANQKRNDEFLKGLADSVSSTKLLGNGLHPEDVKQLTDYQNKTKELYAKASQATNPQERALLKADVDKSIEQQLEYVNGAKFFRQGIGKVTGRMFEHPDEYDDVSRESAKVLNSSSYINALGKGFGVIDDNTFKRRPDQAPLIKAFDELDKTVKQGAGHDVKRISTENIGGGSYRFKKSIDPLIILNNAIVSVKSNDGLKYLLKEQYKLANPTATTMPTDEELGNELVNIWKSKKQGQDPYSIFGDPQKVSTAGGESESEKKESKLLKERVSNIKSLVENKDQTVFESLKSSLPVNSKVKWLTTKGKVIGMQIDAPKSYDDEGNLIGAISQRIDFTKGDPYKTINVIMNRYFGKKIPNEALQSQGVGGNVRVNKIEATTIPTTNPVKFSAVQESAIARAIKDNPGVPRATIIKALGLQ